MKEHLSTDNEEAPKRFATVAFLGRRNNCVIVNGFVNSEARNLLIDTGATMIILKPEVVTTKKRVKPSSWILQTATGAQAETFGEAVAAFLIGRPVFQHRVLVAKFSEWTLWYGQVWIQIDGFKR